MDLARFSGKGQLDSLDNQAFTHSDAVQCALSTSPATKKRRRPSLGNALVKDNIIPCRLGRDRTNERAVAMGVMAVIGTVLENRGVSALGLHH